MRIKQLLNPKKTLLEDQYVAASIVTDVLLELKALTNPDVSLAMLDEIAERMIKERGGIPYNLGYKPEWASTPYPATICCSVDYEVCHAPPRGRTLKSGQIVKYDLGVRYKSGCGDAALTVAVGEIDNRKVRAMRHGLEALHKGIEVVRAGAKIGEIGEAIERFVGPRGYNIIKEYGGHHIGREIHEAPQIPHYTDYQSPGFREVLKEGAIICIEPMITPGNGRVAIAKEDGWTTFVPDGQCVVMFEHMILVLKDSYEILTKHI
jgi:methionyl aminopeptidase